MKKRRLPRWVRSGGSAILLLFGLVGCDEDGGGSNVSATTTTTNVAAIDITDSILTEDNADCDTYADIYGASVLDIQRAVGFGASIEIESDPTECTLTSNAIPNHDFNDATAAFATAVSATSRTFTITRSPAMAASLSPLSQMSYDAVLLNGVVVDLLSAGCYRPNDPMADTSGNVQIGCSTNTPWLLDPLGPGNGFGADAHNAHTQPDGTYHYHGNPEALFDDAPGPNGSPLIGFAADGYPIYGSYFHDGVTLRKALSGYTLIPGMRPSGPLDPGGFYDGQYIDDYEFTDAGDLDECNGMVVDGEYGYFVTDAYPWILNCFIGTPDASFNK